MQYGNKFCLWRLPFDHSFVLSVQQLCFDQSLFFSSVYYGQSVERMKNICHKSYHSFLTNDFLKSSTRCGSLNLYELNMNIIHIDDGIMNMIKTIKREK